MSANGKLEIDKGELVEVQDGILAEPATALDWLAMVAAAAAGGVRLWITSRGGYADLATQRARRAAGSASGIAVAAAGKQGHGWGDRVDVGSFGAKYGVPGIARAKWLHAHASEFGFVFEFGPADPNHLFHARDAHTPPQAPNTENEEDEMGTIRYLHKKADQGAQEFGIFGVDPALPGGFKVSTDPKDGEAWGRVFGRPNGAPWIENLTRDQWINTQQVFAGLASVAAAFDKE